MFDRHLASYNLGRHQYLHNLLTGVTLGKQPLISIIWLTIPMNLEWCLQ